MSLVLPRLFYCSGKIELVAVHYGNAVLRIRQMFSFRFVFRLRHLRVCFFNFSIVSDIYFTLLVLFNREVDRLDFEVFRVCCFDL